MKKEYQKPEVEEVSLVTEEQIATNDLGVGLDAQMGVSATIFQ